MMEKQPAVLTEVERQLIEDDKRLSHAVFCSDISLKDELVVEDEIEQGLLQLRNRAQAADMMMLNTSVSQSAYYHQADGWGHLVITVLCAWVDRETMEKAARQQQLAGQPGDPRFMGGKR